MITTIDKVYMMETEFISKGSIERHITHWKKKEDALQRAKMYAKCYSARFDLQDISDNSCVIYYDGAKVESDLQPIRSWISIEIVN